MFWKQPWNERVLSLLFLANPSLIEATQHEDQITVPRAEESSYATKKALTSLDLQTDMKFNLVCLLNVSDNYK